MPGLPYGVVETRGNTLSVSNDPVPGHHTRGDRHESRSGLYREPLRCVCVTPGDVAQAYVGQDLRKLHVLSQIPRGPI